jgi:hypothetical protein
MTDIYQATPLSLRVFNVSPSYLTARVHDSNRLLFGVVSYGIIQDAIAAGYDPASLEREAPAPGAFVGDSDVDAYIDAAAVPRAFPRDTIAPPLLASASKYLCDLVFENWGLDGLAFLQSPRGDVHADKVDGSVDFLKIVFRWAKGREPIAGDPADDGISAAIWAAAKIEADRRLSVRA